MKQKITLGENETEFESLSQEEVESTVSTLLDDRLSKLEIPAAFDSEQFKTDILGEVASLFESNKTDEDALVKKLSQNLDGILGKALKGVSNNDSKVKEPGWLSKALSG